VHTVLDEHYAQLARKLEHGEQMGRPVSKYPGLHGQVLSVFSNIRLLSIETEAQSLHLVG
jgi:hypothetical protein